MTALYISLLLQCLTGLAIIGAAFAAWQGTNMNKVASAKADLPAEKKNPGNPWLIAATLLTIAALVLGALGFGSTAYGTFKNAPAVTETETPPVPDGQQPPAGNDPKPSFEMPGDLQVTGTTIYADMFYIRADITYFNTAHTKGEVWINVAAPLYENMTIGPAYDGNEMHERVAFTSTDGMGWPNLYKDMCQYAEDITLGAINGSTDFLVHYPNGNGGYLPVNKIPDCKKVPLYVAP